MGEGRNTGCESGPDIVCLGGRAEKRIVCIQGGGGTSRTCNGKGWNYDVCFTLNAVDIHGVAYEVYSTGASPMRQQDTDR